MKISIVTVSFNSANTIVNTINSVNEQSYFDLEHILIDGKSTDSTFNIINSLSKRSPKILSEPDGGIYDAMNKGIKMASGDIVGMLNSDDKFISKDTVKTIAESFNKYDIDCTYGNMIYRNIKGNISRTWKSSSFVPGLFEKSWSPAHPTFYCKRELYNKYGYYKTDYQIAADVELMLRFLQVHKIKSHHIDDFLVEMLEGGVSNNGLKSTMTITKEMKKAFRENNLKLPLFKYIIHKAMKIKEYI